MERGELKLVELETLRGIAALIVLIHHSLLAFFPRVHGLLEPDSKYALFGTPFFAVVNGSAAVVLFFVLSGFVLTLKASCSNEKGSNATPSNQTLVTPRQGHMTLKSDTPDRLFDHAPNRLKLPDDGQVEGRLE